MDGTTPLIINRVGVIRNCHFRASPIQTGWPGMLSPAHQYPTPGFPRLFMTDICTGSDHITLTKVQDWSVTAGVFDPFYLFGPSLKRYANNNTQATQDLDNLQTNETYSISISGDATVSFSAPASAPVTYSWGANTKVMSNNTETVTFTVNAPTSISIKLNNNTDEVTGISMTDSNGVEMLSNIDFVSVEEQFYDIEGWYVDSEDERIVPHSTLGWLQGFNDTQIFTIFE